MSWNERILVQRTDRIAKELSWNDCRSRLAPFKLETFIPGVGSGDSKLASRMTFFLSSRAAGTAISSVEK